MNLIERFALASSEKDNALLQDTREYLDWATSHGESEFTPLASDDVAIRTYLLDCRVQGANRETLSRIASSLEILYAWLKDNGLIDENPFEKFNLKLPFLDRRLVWTRHETFHGSPQEREIAHLRALNHLEESLNRAPDVKSMLDITLETLLGVMTLNTAWISLKADSGLINPIPDPPPAHGFILGAAHNLPPGLEKSERHFLTRPPACHCQQLLSQGRLKRGVNVVECSRLTDAQVAGEKNNGLMFHASVPIVCHDQTVGIMNFAAKEWLLLSASDLQFLTTSARQLGAALERAQLYDLEWTRHASLEHELEMARKVQISLFPSETPKIPGYSLAAFWQPAHGTSGDYYNIFKLPDGRWGLVIADVSGKGAPAALYMTMIHGLIRERVNRVTSPAALLTQMNQMLCEQNMEMQFVTAFYAILEPEKASLQYAIAGHPPPFLRKASGRVDHLAGKGIALGISPEAGYDDLHLTLAPGDSLVAFTDGMTDANNPSSESYEVPHLKAAISAAPTDARGLVKHLQNKLLEWVKEAPNYDDITLLVLARKAH